VAIHKSHQSRPGCVSIAHPQSVAPFRRLSGDPREFSRGRRSVVDALGERKAWFHVRDLDFDAVAGRRVGNEDGKSINGCDAVALVADIDDLDVAGLADADRRS